MVDNNIIINKINAINYNIARISKYKGILLDEFLNNDDIKDIVTHNIFVMLQNIIDIGTHIIADENMEEPIFVSDIADILSKGNVIRKELVRPLKAMAGLRNIIAHEYGGIDFKIIHKILSEELSDVHRLLDDIIKYIGL